VQKEKTRQAAADKGNQGADPENEKGQLSLGDKAYKGRAA
jgi:hypothetical protein